MDAVGIVNMALGWLGANLVSTLDEVSPLSTEEQLAARLYPQAVRSVLEARAWTFATKRLTSGPAALTGLVDFPSKYPIDSTVVRVLSVDDGSGANDLEWRREGDQVLTQSSPTTLYLKVVVDEGDPAVYPPGFCRAVAARLAADMAGPLTENVALGERMEERYLRELRLAGSYDGQQGRTEGVLAGPAARARW